MAPIKGVGAMSLLPKNQPVEIEFRDLSYVVPLRKKRVKKTILKNVSGLFRSGQLTAIMGPSGAGKTTLMHISAGYKVSNVQGTILINGKPRNVRQFRKMACYIMQDDHHLPHLTITEAMTVAANLKVGNSMKVKEKQKLIHEILKTLSLKDCLETRTSDLSGGQRKRLSIALELVNNPTVMFFDEPTSGLDSQNSFQCINLLKTLAEEGRTIVCTIHQPSARLYEMFDYLYALSDGHCVYRGIVSGLLPFLSSMDMECPSYHNPADFLIEVTTIEENTDTLAKAVTSGKCLSLDTIDGNLNRSGGQDVKDNSSKEISLDQTNEVKYIFSRKGHSDVENGLAEDGVQEEYFFPASPFTQFCVLLERNYLSIMRDSMLTKLRLISHIVVGILIGTLYYNIGNEASEVFSNGGFLFCCILFTIFAGMMPTLLTFPMEMKVFVREHHNCWYSLKAYYAAKTIADIPFQILYPVLYVLIVYFMTNQPPEGHRFCMFTVMCVMTSFVAQSLALVIGAAMEIQEATFFAPVISIPILLFSGFFVPFSTMPVYLRWLTYVSYMRYGLEGAMLAIFGFDRDKMNCSQVYCHFKSPQKFLEKLNYEGGNYLVDFLALWVFFIVLRIGGYFVLRWKIRSGR